MFFPNLKRQEIKKYYSQRNDFYANYQHNYTQVAKDCLHRCVYCDATEAECGGDKFSLDHFRPKQVFIDKFNGILIKHPHNLYLSCQKCNVLKSNDWKGCTDYIDGPTYSLNQGYIDRFKDDFHNFMTIDEGGIIIPKVTSGPAEYMIKRLLLNRPNRVYLRKRRLVNLQGSLLKHELNNNMDKVMADYHSGKRTPEESLDRIGKLQSLRRRFDSIIHN